MKNIVYAFILVAILVTTGIFVVLAPKNSNMPTSVVTTSQGINQEKKYTIVAFGDSLTAGYGVSLDESYPSLLQERLLEKNKDITVINMGVSGETTSGGVDRVAFVLAQKPDLILLGLGANDMLRASSPKIAKENLKIIIEKAKAENIPILLLGMQSVSSNGKVYRDEFDAIYPSLAKEYRLPLVPFFLEGVALVPSLNTADGIHPNKLGYEKIIDKNILPTLLPLLGN